MSSDNNGGRDRADFHDTIPVQVWADVDCGIADLVRYLNTIPGLRTDASCQGGKTYGPYVMVHWSSEEAFARIKAEFDLSEVHEAWCHVHPREEVTLARNAVRDE